MTYDGLILAAVIAELDESILRGRIQRIRQHNATDITLEIRAPGHTYPLFLSADARFPRAHLTTSAIPVPQQAPGFCMLLRKHIEGAIITGIEQAGFDRIMVMTLDCGERGAHLLIAEIMGKHSNIVLTDATGRILGAAKHVGASVSRARQILPGRQYVPPPGSERPDPRKIDHAGFESLWRAVLPDPAACADVHKWLTSTFSGIGGFLADELAARAGGGEVRMDDARRELSATLAPQSFQSVLITDETGEDVIVYPIRSVRYDEHLQHLRQSLSEALDTHFRLLVARTSLDDEKAQTLTAIRRAAAARRQTIKSIDRTLAEAEKADRYRELGELLSALTGSIQKGEKAVTLVDYFDTTMPEISVELDERLTPRENVERYFKRYQKARDSVAASQARRAHVDDELRRLEDALSTAEKAASVDGLKSLRERLTKADLLRAETVRESTTESEFGGEKIRRVVTPEGYEILYGENSRANDHLTQRIARPNDLWLHARSITGAHVVIRTAGHSGEIPRAVILRASSIAAQNSEAKHSSLVPIDYTRRKYVRKPRGAAPGFVIYTHEKTMDISPDR